MAESTLGYRIRQHGTKWIWQVLDDRKQVLASGVATSSAAARIEAFHFCLVLQSNQSDG